MRRVIIVERLRDKQRGHFDGPKTLLSTRGWKADTKMRFPAAPGGWLVGALSRCRIRLEYTAVEEKSSARCCKVHLRRKTRPWWTLACLFNPLSDCARCKWFAPRELELHGRFRKSHAAAKSNLDSARLDLHSLTVACVWDLFLLKTVAHAFRVRHDPNWHWSSLSQIWLIAANSLFWRKLGVLNLPLE